jgi:hypothetical protein
MTVLLAGWLSPAGALANGRPPTTNGVHFGPGDLQSIYVATTFGLLISRDDGCSFRWICEDNLGYGGMFDPKYRIARDGAIFATTFTGLRVSRDGGCSFTTATVDRPADDPGRIAGKWIDAIDIGPTGELWVATADNGKPNNIYRSTDNGLTFEPRGMQSPAIWWKSVLVAPTRATRIYATGYQVAGMADDGGQMPPTAHFLISDDGGDAWTPSPLAGVRYGPTPIVLVVGVDRTNPDIVIMISTSGNRPEGDLLYRSTDGGVTWAEVLASPEPILDVTLTDAGGVLVATLGGATFQSTDHGASFAAMADTPQLACIGQRPDGSLYGCATNWEPDFKAVAQSADGTRWDKVFRFVDLAGPLDCPAGTAEHDACGGQWPALQQQFGAVGPTTGMCVAPMPDVTVPSTKAGCCAVGHSSPGELGALGVLALLTLRRVRGTPRRRARTP